jgi:hypothetical protein
MDLKKEIPKRKAKKRLSRYKICFFLYSTREAKSVME